MKLISRHMRFALSLVLIFLIFNTENIPAQSDFTRHRFTLDSRYIFQGYSNQALGQFGIDLINLVTVPADLLIKPGTSNADDDKKFLFYNSQELRNVGNGLLLFLGSGFLSTGYMFTYHEYGHGTRTAAIGYKPFYGHGSIETDADVNAVLSGVVKLYDDFLSFYLASISNTGGFTIARAADTLFSPLTNELNNGWDGLITTGGLNNEMLFTEFVENELYRNGGHIGFLIPYLGGKLSAQSYGTGVGVFNDVTNIASYYQTRGYDVDTEKLSAGSKVSFYTSALSYQFIYQLARMLSGKSSRFTPWELHGIQLPNTSFYMNRDGLSYKIRSGYRNGSWRFPFAVERIFEGEKRTEVSFGAERRFEKLTATVEAIVGQRLDLAVNAKYFANKWLMLSGGYGLYNKQNLYGERVIPSLENGSAYHDLNFRVSLIYR